MFNQKLYSNLFNLVPEQKVNLKNRKIYQTEKIMILILVIKIFAKFILPHIDVSKKFDIKKKIQTTLCI